ncbi:hypothetical protein [Streptomyces sp. CA-111067]|uniref:hypothetical protein n=1 Tax=Streptomyces sp. CA-111067 TaxID=3240046 RepID=UPI003D989967
MFRRVARPVARIMALVCVLALAAGCWRSGGPPPKIPMPSNVPTGPDFVAAVDIQARLSAKGLPCTKAVGENSADQYGSTLTCAVGPDGSIIEINVLDPKRFSRLDVGDAIGAGRRKPFHQTIVAAGNWFIWVKLPSRAPDIARALGGVVLPPIDQQKIPKYPLPAIPATPRFTKVTALADELAGSAGCRERHTASPVSLTCETGAAGAADSNCATLTLYPSDAARDEALREAIAYVGVPATVVTAANWTVDLCDASLGNQVATDLGGVVVSYDGN